MLRAPILKTLQRRGGVLPVALGAIALSGMVLVSVSSSWTWSKAAKVSRVSRLMFELTPMQLEVGVRRAGLTPERLAAAGLGPAEVSALVLASRTYLDEHQAGLESADSAAGAARAERDRLQRLVESGLALDADITALAAAQTALSAALETRDTLLATLYTAAVAGLGADSKAALTTMKFNGAWDLPTQYLAVNHDQRQWVDLRDDLANLRIAAQLGEDPDPACAQDVTTANADPAVSAATTNISNRLAVVNAAWSEAIGG